MKYHTSLGYAVLVALATLFWGCGGSSYEEAANTKSAYETHTDSRGLPLTDEELTYLPESDECNNSLVIDTTTGGFCGVEDNATTVYRGIKYAQSGRKRRWLPPLTPPLFTDRKRADTFGKECFQLGKDQSGMSEECLFLNVWVPQGVKAGDDKDVLIWIHGGAFLFGAGSDPLYNGAPIANADDVIVVTLNYRLAVFGFLNLPKEYSNGGYTGSGNFGLMDQSMAIKWVYDNIGNFGGNKENITIFGESAGSMSVGFHLINNTAETSRYFKAAVMESPYMGFPIKPAELAESIGKETGDFLRLRCASVAKLDPQCIYDLSANTIQDNLEGLLALFAVTDIPKFRFNSLFAYEPYIDNDLVHDNLLFGKVEKPLLIGNNQNEATAFVLGLNDGLDKFIPKIFNDQILEAISKSDESYKEFLTSAFADSSEQGLNMPEKIMSIPRYQRNENNITDYTFLENLVNDYAFFCPSRNFLAFNGNGNYRNKNTYLYHFDYVSTFNNWGTSAGVAFCNPPQVCHGAEMPYVFGNWVAGGVPVSVTDNEKYMSSGVVMPIWKAFAINTNHQLPGFNPYNPATDNYIELNNTAPYQFGLSDFGDEHNCSMWDEFYKYQVNPAE